MRIATLAGETDFDGWRAAARAFRQAGVAPGEAAFRVGRSVPGLFDEGLPAPPTDASFHTPRAFVELAQSVILHRSEDRFDLLYRLLWRLKAEPDLIRVVTDVDVADAMERAKNVSRASHKMKAFVRFRRIEAADGEHWIAWFEPAHRVVERTAPFFVRRFPTMRWSILTPDGSAVWDAEALAFGPPATRDMAPSEDEVEDFWKTYYASTFNPARLKLKTMQGEMPKRYWKNLPEAALIRDLTARSATRTETMVAAPASEPNLRLAKTLSRINRDHAFEEGFVPSTLEELGQAVQACRRCPLWRDATQGVCGAGVKQARLMIVGEQPGDQEDLAGRPFVGPAGRVLDEALLEAGIDREDAFVTNAVKHFKHEPRGKRRIHKTPLVSEVSACRWWLDAERRLVRPKVIVTLGATAALGVLNRKIAVRQERGHVLAQPDGARVVATVHPSYLLRLPDEAARTAERRRFVEDLKRVRALL
ncbi:MAG: UdgX family uracil-DNA binding protein [Pseudomonadota bacterium]|nr:UdgX family uracil-DNA binding protein [Pseudomonadota bacterium]